MPGALLWPWVLGVGLAVALGVGLGPPRPEHPTPVALPNAYRLLVGVELFLLLAVAPLVSPVAEARGGGQARRPLGLAPLVVLLVIGGPGVVAAAWAADAGGASVAASQGFLLLAAAAVSGYLRADRDGSWRPAWWLVLSGLGGGAPLVAFVVGDLFPLSTLWLYALSPFWVADRLCLPWDFAWAWAVPAAALAALALALHLWACRDGA